MTVTYAEARADHEYLWGIDAAADMTGGYVDQEDLYRLLKNPTRATARKCYVDQIKHWLSQGPQTGGIDELQRLLRDDARVMAIRARYCTIGTDD